MKEQTNENKFTVISYIQNKIKLSRLEKKLAGVNEGIEDVDNQLKQMDSVMENGANPSEYVDMLRDRNEEKKKLTEKRDSLSDILQTYKTEVCLFKKPMNSEEKAKLEKDLEGIMNKRKALWKDLRGDKESGMVEKELSELDDNYKNIKSRLDQANKRNGKFKIWDTFVEYRRRIATGLVALLVIAGGMTAKSINNHKKEAYVKASKAGIEQVVSVNPDLKGTDFIRSLVERGNEGIWKIGKSIKEYSKHGDLAKFCVDKYVERKNDKAFFEFLNKYTANTSTNDLRRSRVNDEMFINILNNISEHKELVSAGFLMNLENIVAGYKSQDVNEAFANVMINSDFFPYVFDWANRNSLVYDTTLVKIRAGLAQQLENHIEASRGGVENYAANIGFINDYLDAVDDNSLRNVFAEISLNNNEFITANDYYKKAGNEEGMAKVAAQAEDFLEKKLPGVLKGNENDLPAIHQILSFSEDSPAAKEAARTLSDFYLEKNNFKRAYLMLRTTRDIEGMAGLVDTIFANPGLDEGIAIVGNLDVLRILVDTRNYEMMASLKNLDRQRNPWEYDHLKVLKSQEYLVSRVDQLVEKGRVSEAANLMLARGSDGWLKIYSDDVYDIANANTNVLNNLKKAGRLAGKKLIFSKKSYDFALGAMHLIKSGDYGSLERALYTFEARHEYEKIEYLAHGVDYYWEGSVDQFSDKFYDFLIRQGDRWEKDGYKSHFYELAEEFKRLKAKQKEQTTSTK